MFPIYPNMPAIGALVVLTCIVGFGLFGGIGAVVGTLAVTAFFVGREVHRARRHERDQFQMHVDRVQDQAQFAKRKAD